MSSKLLLAFSPHQNSTTLYLTSLAALGSASATLLALSYFKPSNLGQNDLHHDWKSLSLLSEHNVELSSQLAVTLHVA